MAMTEDEIMSLLKKADTTKKRQKELKEMIDHCWGNCSKPPAACNECAVADIKAVLEYCLRGGT